MKNLELIEDRQSSTTKSLIFGFAKLVNFCTLGLQNLNWTLHERQVQTFKIYRHHKTLETPKDWTKSQKILNFVELRNIGLKVYFSGQLYPALENMVSSNLQQTTTSYIFIFIKLMWIWTGQQFNSFHS